MTNAVFNELMNIAGWPIEIGGHVRIVGNDPVLPTRFKVGEVAAGIHAACGVAAAYLWELRTGRWQQVEVNVRHAAASFESYIYLRRDAPLPPRPRSLMGFCPTRDGRWFYLHGSFPDSPTYERTLQVLECEGNIESVAMAVQRWDAQNIEDALAEAGCCGAMVRTTNEWAAHPQGQTLSKLGAVEVVKIGDSEPEPFRAEGRPMAGMRVLDLTGVLAGPTCARTLAEHGADVLRIDSPNLPSAELFVLDTGHGKRSTFLDLRQDSDAETLWGLVRDADVLSQSFRPGALDKLGFSPEAVAEARPGIVYVTTNCYGHEGPWHGRRGWEQLAQSVTGLADEEGAPAPPQLLPSPAAVTDYSTGYLAAFGALVALCRRAVEGGSYLVRTSMSQAGMLLGRSGRVLEADVTALQHELSSDDYRKLFTEDEMPWGRIPHLPPEESNKLSIQTETAYGPIRHLSPVVHLSETEARWALPTVPVGSSKPVWFA